uniref:Si:dkey-23i12.7 n=1 Tax=Sinocyclocheilus anshuiensis TaxID=1608454 RepID=A0A671NPG8_9TELE
YLEMPAALMDNFDQGSPFSQSDSQKDHRHHRREKNRDAARKSRRKHTEKADLLHEELQTLEQSNAAFVKEIAELKKELQLYTSALEQHIPHCTKLCPFEPSAPVTGVYHQNDI